MSWKTVDKQKVTELLSSDLGEGVKNLLKSKKLLVNSSMPKEVVMVSEELFKVFDKIKQKGIQPLFLGVYVCDTRDFKKARLKLPFAYKAVSLDLPKAYIKPKGEQLFLYGRDIISESVIKTEGGVRRGGLLIVLNQEGEFLGLGFSREELIGKGKTVVIRKVVDIGHYLRVERS